MPRNMLTDDLDDIPGDTTSTPPDMSALSNVEETPLDQYNRLRLELQDVKKEYSKYARPDLRRIYWKKLPPLITKMNSLKSQVNALELQLKDQLL